MTLFGNWTKVHNKISLKIKKKKKKKKKGS